MSILVIAEYHNNSLSPATLSTLSAAKTLGSPIHVAVLGSGPAASEVAQVEGVEKVLQVDHGDLSKGVAEASVPTLLSIAKNYKAILFPSTTFGKNLMPRLAALLDVAPLSDVIQIVDATTFVRPIYAGNALCKVQSTDPIQVMTIRPTAFPRAAKGQTSAPIEPLAYVSPSQNIPEWVGLEATVSARPDLGSASIVVSGGRALQSKENFRLIEELADLLGGAVGASRAAVDAGYVSNDCQVGQTGKVVAPQLYIAVGISGAIQHLAGMKDSKVIVAINKDPEAPIFQVADYGLVADLFQAVPELTEKLKGLRKAS